MPWYSCGSTKSLRSGWPGHPLRKDFVEPEEYHGITTSRESLLKA